MLEDADVDLHGHVRVIFTVSDSDLPLSLAEVQALDPRFTLAALAAHPVDGLPAWTSLLLNGSATARIKPSGPETPAAAIITSLAQPGSETPAALVDLGGGRYRHTFASPLPAGIDAGDTLRVGVWLEGASSPSLRTSSTLDFTPAGAAPQPYDTVLADNCNRCHGNLVLHESRAGAKLCLTCHTWQNADPDTFDPASMGSSATNDPNPLELGRLVHRIHRGRRLPTLYRSSSQAVPAPALAAGNDLPLPFTPETSSTPIVGRKFSVVGLRSAEVVFGRVVQRTDNNQPARTVAAGITFPRDLRDCEVCHAGAPRRTAVETAVSRRICAGCHPDVWYGTAPITDLVHLAHPGGPQADDGECVGCHVDPAGTAAPKLYAPIAEAHVVPPGSAWYNEPVVELVRVEGMVPGGRPRVTFRVLDRVGPIAPRLDAPAIAFEPATAPTSSFVPRRFSPQASPSGSFAIRIAGPTTPDYGTDPALFDPISSGTASGNPDPYSLTTEAGTDEYVYQFTSVIPPGASGTWTVGVEARRRAKRPHYDKATDTFNWPYTGETVAEIAGNAIAYVDLATGTWPPGGTPRRTVVADEKCLRCHGVRIDVHGGVRNRVAWCLVCHHPQKTDFSGRTKQWTGGPVNLNASFDGIEERSIHLKVMVHRIHTGGRKGSSTLEAIQPHVIGRAGFFDEGCFPNDLANCTLCHQGKSYLLDAVPADARPTVANETATIFHVPFDHDGNPSTAMQSARTHSAGEPSTPPIQAACLGCHATGATIAHAASHTSGGVEGCSACHGKGARAVEVVHGLATATGVTASFSSIVEGILVPGCATSACHSGSPPVATPRLDAPAAYAELVGVQSTQSPLRLVEPGAPERSYLLYKMRGDAASAGGSPTTAMPPSGALVGAADLAAIEAWISNGAPND